MKKMIIFTVFTIILSTITAYSDQPISDNQVNDTTNIEHKTKTEEDPIAYVFCMIGLCIGTVILISIIRNNVIKKAEQVEAVFEEEIFHIDKEKENKSKLRIEAEELEEKVTKLIAETEGLKDNITSLDVEEMTDKTINVLKRITESYINAFDRIKAIGKFLSLAIDFFENSYKNAQYAYRNKSYIESLAYVHDAKTQKEKIAELDEILNQTIDNNIVRKQEQIKKSIVLLQKMLDMIHTSDTDEFVIAFSDPLEQDIAEEERIFTKDKEIYDKLNENSSERENIDYSLIDENKVKFRIETYLSTLRQNQVAIQDLKKKAELVKVNY